MGDMMLTEVARARAEALVRNGRYDTIDRAVEAGLQRLRDDEDDVEITLDELSPEDRAAIERGIAAADAGDVVDGETFLDELQARYRAMIARS